MIFACQKHAEQVHLTYRATKARLWKLWYGKFPMSANENNIHRHYESNGFLN